MKIRNKGILAAFIALVSLNQVAITQELNEETFKIGRTLGLIDAFYVDTTNLPKLAEKVIVDLLRELDPHSTYISAKDVKEMNEPLIGNFEGIGIQFNLLRDSIIVIEPIAGGPSEKVGLHAGDRIITINGEKVAGTGISTTGVRTRLMGAKGTTVNISIFRRGEKGILDFSIIRDKIPINSLDAAYILDHETGYVRLNKFSNTTGKEFEDAVAKLRKSNLQNIIIDLRSNGGGVMTGATELADHFFTGQKLLVYLVGRKTPRQNYKSTGSGDLTSARVVVLIDEGSASASEIFAGAIQDYDRGVIMGRRSFGKGLVQNGFYLTDGSMIRLTIARYYTPTGRSIQSPYNEGYDKYYSNYVKRFSDGELVSADSVHLPDSLKYTTLVNKRTVYGGGGIMPDLFVSYDTSNYTIYHGTLSRKGVFNSFVLEYSDKNRTKINTEYKSFDDFKSRFEFSPSEIQAFIKKGEDAGVKYNDDYFKKSEPNILKVLKALVANNLWGSNEYFRIMNENDELIEKALKIISDKEAYDSILGYK
ncbi:MAG: S41 family peptidase [Bacteroidales bacterium]|jgi:carboxyl-terminal processing protease|nr:S41 family peptidase [Bacteroidales bacterium]